MGVGSSVKSRRYEVGFWMEVELRRGLKSSDEVEEFIEKLE